MRHHHHGTPGFGDDLHQLILEMSPGERVERSKRFVKQQYLGFDGQCASDPDPLLHATRYFMGQLGFRMREFDELERRVGALFHLCSRLGGGKHPFDAEVHIVKTGQPRQQGVILKDDAPVGTGT